MIPIFTPPKEPDPNKAPLVKYDGGSDEWMAVYFPEYLAAKEAGCRVANAPPIPECTPWRYWSNMIDPAGIVYAVNPDEMGYPQARWVLEEPYAAQQDSINYFENGGKTANGATGLDPNVFVGGVYRTEGHGDEERKFIDCPTGVYEYSSTTGPYKREATFTDLDGNVVYVSDRVFTVNEWPPFDYRDPELEELTGEEPHWP